MFGLLKAKKCGQTAEQKQRRRLHYCGTCKTMGSLYGAKTRFLLNHDTVFLAELLTAISAEGENHKTWHTSFQSYNCLTLPKNADEMPVSLQFAATANVVLTEFKVRDQIIDSKKFKWKVTQRVFSKSFRQAAQKLKAAQFPLETLFAQINEQEKRENTAFANETAPDEVLNFLAEPTATATALFFENGAKSVNRAEFAENFGALGRNFGKLVYLLDAFEDYEKDVKHGEFNAIRTAFGLSEKTLTPIVRRQIVGKLQAIQTDISLQIQDLPIPEEIKTIFIARFETNLSRKFQTKLPVLAIAKTCNPAKPKASLRDKWKSAKTTAKRLTVQGFSAKTWRDNWQIPFVFAFVAVFAFIAPSYAKQARSWQECAGLSLNLMFLGVIFGSVVSAIGSTVKPLTNNVTEDLTEKAREELRKRAKGEDDKSGWCDCCGECACDGCCDSCDCCDCGSCCDCGGCCDCN